jgi:hypothetical protein
MSAHRSGDASDIGRRRLACGGPCELDGHRRQACRDVHALDAEVELDGRWCLLVEAVAIWHPVRGWLAGRVAALLRKSFTRAGRSR